MCRSCLPLASPFSSIRVQCQRMPCANQGPHARVAGAVLQMVHVWAGVYVPPDEDAELIEVEDTKLMVTHRWEPVPAGPC